ncbi:DUF4296 domain-containing protein [uncultured Aquimarina sp.]|uniref:DUF4296 domain-containing protein n=1 Tax=uncultured Aquimarina sp. TaxID=575652 RepID=UPI00260DCD0B|nr:DUF4296 domain-containing protein [uncultured Aquimarina sp.]
MKKRIVCSFFALVLIVFSCQKLDKTSRPENLIAEDKMVEILTDIAFVKAAKGSYKKVFDIEKINPEAYILQKHGIDSLVFSENNSWYANQLDEYEKIFNKVKNNLEVSKTKFEKLKKEEDSIKKIEDSIRKAKDGYKGEKLIPASLEELETINEESIEEEIESAINKRSKSIPLVSKKKKQSPQ